MEVKAIRCLICQDVVFSRATHDYRTCSCGNVSIDGGFNYTRISFKNEDYYELTKVNIRASKKELHNDWNKRKNHYGVLVGV